MTGPRAVAVSLGERVRYGLVSLMVVAVVGSLALQALWFSTLSTAGGDAAAQDAWARFAQTYPGSAYDLAWYGGMHPVSYSVVSPYLMALVGVRTTMLAAGVVSGALLAVLVDRVWSGGWRRYGPTLAGVAAFFGNAASGRVTFALGTAIGLATLCLLLAVEHWRGSHRRRVGHCAVAALAALSTAASPVSGLFLAIVAGAWWPRRRRTEAYVIGLPPVVVVGVSALLFPFSGQQPMTWVSVILPMIMGLSVAALAPRGWRELRVGALVYIVAVLVVWLVPSPIGTNISRLGLVFGGVVLVAVLGCGDRGSSLVARRWGARASAVALGAAVTTSATWQVVLAAQDVVNSRPPAALSAGLAGVMGQLDARDADLVRVEVVPTRSHREAAAFASVAALARGWNRQADVARNPLFYADGALTARSYLHWLGRWAVTYVVLSDAEPDGAAIDEARLVRGGLPYLREVWRDPNWRIYQVRRPTPLVDEPGRVVQYDAAELTLEIPQPGDYTVRITYSPWLTLVDDHGQPTSSDVAGSACLAPAESGDWVTLRADAAGIYRLAAPYRVGGGSTCS
jgi:hypothetical protein